MEILGRYMVDPSKDNVVLRVPRTVTSGKKIWSDIRPADWVILLQEHNQMGVFQVNSSTPNLHPLVEIGPPEPLGSSYPVMKFIYGYDGPKQLRAWIPTPDTYKVRGQTPRAF